MRITKEFRIAAAHKLQGECYGKCSNLHGHEWKLLVTINGEINDIGFIMNFNELKAIVTTQIIDKLDHSYLNDMFPLPTAEIMSKEIFAILFKELPNLYEVQLWETETSSAIYNLIDYIDDKKK